MKTTIYSTRYPGLGYGHFGRAAGWRFIDTETLATIGMVYPLRSELLADVERFAAELGLTIGKTSNVL